MATTDEAAAKRPARAAVTADGDYSRPFVPTAVTMVGVTAILYLGREVFLPLAVAFLLTFALAPMVSALRKRSVPKVPAVILTVVLAFMAIGLFSFVVATQVSTLAQNIPTYQSNILDKVRALREVGANGGIIDRLSSAVERVGAELQRGTQTAPAAEPETPPREPLPVEIVARQNPIETLKNVIVPLAAPFATAGLIIVVVIFMLLEREDLRDRFIRLVGYSDLHRTTEALQDAGKRVGRYLLMQLVVNTTYAVPITIGLWLIGIPNALLWGLLALVLRFVPYIGPAIAMMLPLLLALAVAPGWSLVLWTAGLFLVMELVSNNILEPWLYGSRTGLSPLAIIVAAIFWTWLWGPLGLVLSTPLTVCLVVLGRHVPQFAFLDVLLGNEPVLEPHARLYQRLLAGDPDEATDNAEEFLEEQYLVDYYDRIGIPALLIGESDRQRGVMSDEQRKLLAASALTLVENLEDVAQEEEEDDEEDEKAEKAEKDAGKAESAPAEEEEDAIETPDLPDGEGHSLLCLGGRGELDDAAAAMLAQVLEVQGAEAATGAHTALEGRAVTSLPLGKVDTVIVAFLNAGSQAHARHVVRRLKRAKSGLRVGIFVPRAEGESATVKADAISADFVAGSIAEAVTSGLEDKPAVRLKAAPARLSRRRARPRKPASAAA
ncbi:AI-2E family transporter [Aquamicrobium terrae]|uniref:PurR-regulated permease PerM n=1 Tax=Aquamicrobium terrae TaxID=1324945 RepID=A0ABV2N511_9HYPH